MLITYPNTLGKDLKELNANVSKYFGEAIGGIHILPFFPSSGDRGFAVIDYDKVDPLFGTWEDIDTLADKYFLMADFMLNHVSIRSKEFKDYMENGDNSEYKDMFIEWEKFWPNGAPTKEELESIYKRKPGGPYKEFTRKDGKTVRLWNTFFEEQIDINPYSDSTQKYYEKNLQKIASHVPLIRYDAFAYTSKRPGTTCFFVEPDIWKILDISMLPLKKSGTEMLPEIHENYNIQLKMSEHGYWVYDFALPMLLLHGLKTGRTDRLIHWLNICPRKQFTTLDTHDGIGVVDVAGLLTDEEIDVVRNDVDDILKDIKPFFKFPMTITKDNGKARQYQLSSTYYSALRCNDNAYLLARAVQFFTPGIPQVYYVGMLAGENDEDAIKRGEEPRSINRHTYSEEAIKKAVEKPIFKNLYKLMTFRNTYDAFNGEITVGEDKKDGKLLIIWTKNTLKASLKADFKDFSFKITYIDKNTGEEKDVDFEL